MNPVAIGIDVGGTKIAGALVDADGGITSTATLPSPRSADGADPRAAATTSLIENMLDAATTDGRAVTAVGIGVPEYVTPTGEIASAEVLAWNPGDLDEVRSRVEVLIDSDVRCAARAERDVGGGDRFDSFLFVSIGTGVSHTLCLNDRLVTGHRGEAIALGELPVDGAQALRHDAPLTVEQQASGRAIELYLQGKTDGLADPADRGSVDEASSLAGRIMAAAIVNAIGLLDPQAVILGGGLGSSSGAYTTALVAEAGALLARRPNAPAILRSKLDNRGGVIGAGLKVFEADR